MSHFRKTYSYVQSGLKSCFLSSSSTVWLCRLWQQVMDEEYSVDPAQLLEAASDFAHRPG